VVSGASQGTTAAGIVRGALDGIAHRTADIVEVMLETGVNADALRVDGGLTANRYLVERQADLTGLPVEVASVTESTALGMAGLAGMGAGCIGPEAIAAANRPAMRVAPHIGQPERERERAAWKEFVAWASTPLDHSGGRREAEQAGIDTATEPEESPKETRL
jgi:glycerol kinase